MPLITTGGAAQEALPTNLARLSFELTNLSPTDLWLAITGTAVLGEPSTRLPPGSTYSSPANVRPSNPVSIIGATTGQAFSILEW